MKIDLANALTEGSKMTYHPEHPNLDEHEDFRYNSKFIAFDKAYDAWLELDECLLSESRYYSLTHTLEAKSDLDASIELLARFYYRQSFCTLRTFLEDVLLPYHFFHFPEEFKKWKMGGYHVPNIRGKRGIIQGIKDEGSKNHSNLDRLGAVYDILSQWVHGQPEMLIHAGIDSRDWRGHSYKRSLCLDWLSTATEVIYSAIAITRELEDLWARKSETMGDFCRCCHGEDFKTTVDGEIEGEKVYKNECQRCGHIWYQYR